MRLQIVRDRVVTFNATGWAGAPERSGGRGRPSSGSRSSNGTAAGRGPV
jgi:hypothetical protein